MKQFNALELNELYAMLRLRQEVFIVEQDCPYLDADGYDQKSNHVFGYDNKNCLVAYCRILPPNATYEAYSSIGRVLTEQNARKKQYGKKLMTYAIDETLKLYPDNKIKISAQKYLVTFYSDMGFTPSGKIYMEDGIPHIAMIYNNI